MFMPPPPPVRPPAAFRQRLRHRASLSGFAWPAQWIADGRWPGRRAGEFHFRRVLRLAAAPRSFPVAVSGDTRFLLRVNGHRVGFGPARGNPRAWRYERYDLAPFLHAGQNVIAATVWNFGARGPLAQMTLRSGFLLQGLSPPAEAADTGAGWQVERDRGFSLPKINMGAALRGYYAALPDTRMQAARSDRSWAAWPDTSPNAHWHAARLLGRGSPRGAQDAHTAWWLVRDRLPMMSYSPTSPGQVARVTSAQPLAGCADALHCAFPARPLTLPAHTQVRILLERHALTTAWPVLRMTGGAQAHIQLIYAEALRRADGRKGNRDRIAGKHMAGAEDELIADGSALRYAPPEWRTWRFLELRIRTAGQPLQLLSLQARYSAFPFQLRARIQARRRWLKQVWQVSWRTARLCAHTTYMDCPYWEQLQYIGDTRIQALLSYTLTGDDRLARQAIRQLNESRIPSGITQSRYPSRLPQMIPPFALMWVGMVHDFWMYRGDRAFVQQQLPGVRAVLGWFNRRQLPNGLLGPLPWWNFVDWTQAFPAGVPPGGHRGESAALSLQYAMALRYGAGLEKVFGHPRRAAHDQRRARAAIAAVRRLCWNSKLGLFADTPSLDRYSQQTNILAVWLGVVSRSRGQAILDKILAAELHPRPASQPKSSPAFARRPKSIVRRPAAAPSISPSSTASATMPPTSAMPFITPASYYFRFYLARALDRVGMGHDYIKLLGPWRAMLRRGLTTWAETPPPTRSDCHAWSAHPAYDLLTTVAGIRPAAPGFARVTIAPHLGGLQNFSAVMPTPLGRIHVREAQAGNEMDASVTLPSAMTGTFRWQGQTITLHGGPQSFVIKPQY